MKNHQYTDEEISFGKAWLIAEMEKEEFSLREPLISATYMRDMPLKTSHSWDSEGTPWKNILRISLRSVQEKVSRQKEAEECPEHFTVAPDFDDPPPFIVIDNLEKRKEAQDVWRQERIATAERATQYLLQDALHPLKPLIDQDIKLNWAECLDEVSYRGHDGHFGLMNIPECKIRQSNTPWQKSSTDGIRKDFESMVTGSIFGDTTQFLIPPQQFAFLAVQRAYVASNISILSMLLQELPDFMRYQAKSPDNHRVQIYPSRWCIGAGTNGTDRMVAYVAESEKLYLDIPLIITRVMTVARAKEKEIYFETGYIGKIGEVRFLEPESIRYLDGI